MGRSKHINGDTAKLAGFAAIGLAAGLAATFGRKLMVQGATLVQGSWSEALKAEHAAVLKLFDAIEATDDTQSARRTALLTSIKHALGKHAFEEENVIYPALRQHGFTAEAESLVIDHGDVKHFLFELESMSPDSPAFATRIRDFRKALEEHMREEEDMIFPAMDEVIDAPERKRLTAIMNKEGFKLA